MTTQQPNSFGSLLLRSSTPAPDEKVYKYLKGMEEAQPDTDEPRSLIDSKEDQQRANFIAQTEGDMYSPRTKSETLLNPMNLAALNISAPKPPSSLKPPENKEDDLDSNVQEGMRSELGDFPQHEPDTTAETAARPKYASYDSGPSFGNLGPLPLDDQQHPIIHSVHAQTSWNPDWQNILNNESGQTGGSVAHSGFNGGQGTATPRQTQSNIDAAEVRSSKSRASVTKGSQAMMHSSKQSSHAQSKVASYQGEQDQRPLSPLSTKSRNTGTHYPPLPESRFGDNEEYNHELLASPRSRATRSKAYSISPSDSITNISPKTQSQRVDMYAPRSNASRPPSVMSGNAHNRPFSPYRHAPTQEDLLNAAVRNRALVIPEVPEESASRPMSQVSKQPSKISQAPSKRSQVSVAKQPSHNGSNAERSVRSEQKSEHQSEYRQQDRESAATPRPRSPEGLDAEEAKIVELAVAAARTPRTSYYAGSLEPEVTNHYHDMELCVLLHQESDPSQHEVIKKALRKAVRQRIKKLGMKYDAESIKKYRQSHHDHDPSVHLQGPAGSIEYNPDEPPKWAADLKREMVLMQQRIESLGPKIENLMTHDHSYQQPDSRFTYGPDDTARTPQTQTVNIQTGTVGDSIMHLPGTEMIDEHDEDYDEERYEDDRTGHHQHPYTEGETRSVDHNQSVYGDTENGIPIGFNGQDDSAGQLVLEHELYKLKQTTHGSQTGNTHHSWNIAPGNEDDEDYYDGGPVPTIPDTNGDEMENLRGASPPLPALPSETDQHMNIQPQGGWNTIDYTAPDQTPNSAGDTSGSTLAPWQRVHQRLLSWALVWPMSELENALNSTTRGQQVNETALSIWTSQTYKRYVRARLTDSPPGVVDRLFVPPTMADAINIAVYNGRHSDAAQMLRDMWAPFGFEDTPRLLVVLAKHQNDPNHWVVHRFCLKDASLSTYDCFPGKSNLDGRPLGWWFAIRVAWPNASYPPPDKIVQKMVRLHRPMQLPIDNAVGASGIWRNILMGSRAERSLDLERLRDLINTEVKNLKQRKNLSKLTIPNGRDDGR